MEDYVHRVGRTGRAGMKGTAITASDQERAINDLVRAMKHSKVRPVNAVRIMKYQLLMCENRLYEP